MRLSTLLVLVGSAASTLSLTYKSADISSLLVEEGEGKTYKDLTGKTSPLETMYIEYCNAAFCWLIKAILSQPCVQWNELGQNSSVDSRNLYCD